MLLQHPVRVAVDGLPEPAYVVEQRHYVFLDLRGRAGRRDRCSGEAR